MHLKTYFDRFLASNLSLPDDARLTVRALLDVQTNAKVWPMKVYLDSLIEIASHTPVGQEASETELRARVFQLIGAVQYFAISMNAIGGMYGKTQASELTARFSKQISDTVDSLFGRSS